MPSHNNDYITSNQWNVQKKKYLEKIKQNQQHNQI